MTLDTLIKSIDPHACDEALTWASQYDLDEAALAWRECERGDWLLRIAVYAGVDRRAIERACVEVAAASMSQTRATAMAAWASEASEASWASWASWAVPEAATAATATEAAADDARATSLRVSAEIVRRHIPWRVMRAALRKRGAL